MKEVTYEATGINSFLSLNKNLFFLSPIPQGQNSCSSVKKTAEALS
jgi:hypothetical protein